MTLPKAQSIWVAVQVLLDGRDLRTLSLPWYRCALAHMQAQQHTPRACLAWSASSYPACRSALDIHMNRSRIGLVSLAWAADSNATYESALGFGAPKP